MLTPHPCRRSPPHTMRSPNDRLNPPPYSRVFFLNDPAATEIYTLSLHDALPISTNHNSPFGCAVIWGSSTRRQREFRSEEHTSELQSRENLVCRLLLEKKKKRVMP